MTTFTGSDQPGRHATFYEHALALARSHPDIPLPEEGKPYPDANRRGIRRGSDDRSDFQGTRTAQLIDEFFSTPAEHRDIAELCRKVIEYDIEIVLWPSIPTAISRAHPDEVREIGRHLARTSVDMNPTVLGMAMLAVVGAEVDVPLIQTIGLLSDTFGHLAAQALTRLPKATTNLIWLADRTAAWGRVYLVDAICEHRDPAAESWLLRKACDGHLLNGEFAYKVACAAPIHEAIATPDADEALIDHTGYLLSTLVWCDGMGGTIWDYEHAEQVLADYLSHVRRLVPNLDRYHSVWVLACLLDGQDRPPPKWATLESLRTGYRSLLATPSWHSASPTQRG